MENPLKIENEDISVYGDLPLNVIALDKEFIIRNEGSQTAKRGQRIYSFLILITIAGFICR